MAFNIVTLCMICASSVENDHTSYAKYMLNILLQLFADWGVDYLKMDGCFADPLTFDEGYPMVTRALNESGRHIVFSCSWPAYQVWGGMKVNNAFRRSRPAWKFEKVVVTSADLLQE